MFHSAVDIPSCRWQKYWGQAAIAYSIAAAPDPTRPLKDLQNVSNLPSVSSSPANSTAQEVLSLHRPTPRFPSTYLTAFSRKFPPHDRSSPPSKKSTINNLMCSSGILQDHLFLAQTSPRTRHRPYHSPLPQTRQLPRSSPRQVPRSRSDSVVDTRLRWF